MRQHLLSLTAIALACAWGLADDPKPKDSAKFPEALKGKWGIINAGTSDGANVTSRSSPIKLTIGEGTAEWDSLPFMAEKPGKGVLVAKSEDGKTGSLQLTIGKDVYKGLYQISKEKSDVALKPDQDGLYIVFGPAGADAPKELPKEPKPPKDVKYMIYALRK